MTAGTLTIHGRTGAGIAAIPAWSFTDTANTPKFPAPQITVTEGDTVNITVYNDHTVNHNLVVKGITTDITAITPGTSKLYTFIANAAGTYLYYDSLNNEVNREMGLYGALIVNPKDGSKTVWAGAPTYDFQRTWIMGDMDVANWNTVADANARLSMPVNPPPVVTSIYKPNYFVINGKSGFDAMETITGADTTIEGLRGQSALIRIVNGGLFAQALHFHANHVQVLSKNGMHYPPPYKLLDVVNVPPLSTLDVLFELNQLGEYPMHNHTAQMETANGVYLGGVSTMIIIK